MDRSHNLSIWLPFPRWLPKITDISELTKMLCADISFLGGTSGVREYISCLRKMVYLFKMADRGQDVLGKYIPINEQNYKAHQRKTIYISFKSVCLHPSQNKPGFSLLDKYIFMLNLLFSFCFIKSSSGLSKNKTQF